MSIFNFCQLVPGTIDQQCLVSPQHQDTTKNILTSHCNIGFCLVKLDVCKTWQWRSGSGFTRLEQEQRHRVQKYLWLPVPRRLPNSVMTLGLCRHVFTADLATSPSFCQRITNANHGIVFSTLLASFTSTLMTPTCVWINKQDKSFSIFG